MRREGALVRGNSDMGKPGFVLGARPGGRRETIATAKWLDERGFSHVYCPTFGDGMSLSLAVVMETSQLKVGTGIANIYTRHPASMAETAAFMHELSEGRFLMGLGVSHAPTNDALGVQTGKPLADIRSYVERMREAALGEALPPIILATLRKRMVGLAAEISEGALWAQGVLSHMGASLEAVPEGKRDAFLVGNLAPCAVSDDRNLALTAVRRGLRMYMTLPNYQNYFIEAGYESEVEAARAAVADGDMGAVLEAISEEMADDIGLFGTAAQVRDKVDAWAAAGVEEMTLSAVSTTGNQAQAIEEVAAIFD